MSDEPERGRIEDIDDVVRQQKAEFDALPEVEQLRSKLALSESKAGWTKELLDSQIRERVAQMQIVAKLIERLEELGDDAWLQEEGLS